jgi:hypothetical protein
MEHRAGRAAMGGLVAGVVAAALMLLVAMLSTGLAGLGWYSPLELVGGLATGSPARLQAGLQLSTAIAGVFVYLFAGAAWGALFGLLVGRYLGDLTQSEGLWLGAFYGILVWVLDIFTLMARIDPATAHAIPLWFGALTHVGYGAVLGVTFRSFRRPSTSANGSPPLTFRDSATRSSPPT